VWAWDFNILISSLPQMSVYGSFVFSADDILHGGFIVRDSKQLNAACRVLGARGVQQMFTDKGMAFRRMLNTTFGFRVEPDPTPENVPMNIILGGHGRRDGKALVANLQASDRLIFDRQFEILSIHNYHVGLKRILQMACNIDRVLVSKSEDRRLCWCSCCKSKFVFRVVCMDGSSIGNIGSHCLINKFQPAFIWARVIRMASTPAHGSTWGEIFNDRGVIYAALMALGRRFYEWALVIEVFQEQGVIKQDLVFGHDVCVGNI
jgi:hypothetical protein